MLINNISTILMVCIYIIFYLYIVQGINVYVINLYIICHDYSKLQFVC